MYRALGILIIGCGSSSGQPDAAPHSADAPHVVDARLVDAQALDASADASADGGVITAATVVATVELANTQNSSPHGQFGVSLHTLDSQPINDATVTFTRDGVADSAPLFNPTISPGLYLGQWNGNPSVFSITVTRGSDVLRTYDITAVLAPSFTLTPDPPVHGAPADVTWTRPDVADHGWVDVLASTMGASYTGDQTDPDDGMQSLPATAWPVAGVYHFAVQRSRNPTAEITVRGLRAVNLNVP